MINDSTLRNRRILIKRVSDGEIVADTRIIRFQQDKNICFVSADSLKDKSRYSVTVLVFGTDSLYEFEGGIGGAVVDNEVAVLFGRHRMKEDRKNYRYDLSTGGIISEIYIDDKSVKLLRPMNFITVNLSANGILLRMDSGSFDIGDRFRTEIPIAGRCIEFLSEVVRVHRESQLVDQYGCRIIGK